jgi:hypothetical protein
MSKLLNEQELGAVVNRLIRDASIHLNGFATHKHFLEDLASVVGEYAGADLKLVSHTNREAWMCHFEANASTPDDGGVFKHYDLDVSVEEWFEESGRD